VHEKCGGAGFSTGKKYVNPINPRDAMNIIELSFSQLGQYESASGWEYNLFLYLIVLVWYLYLVSELHRIIMLADFLINFPVADDHSFTFWPRHLTKGIRGTTLREYLEMLQSPKPMKEQEVAEIRSTVSRLSQATNASLMHFKSNLFRYEPGEALQIVDISRPHWVVAVAMLFIRAYLWIYMSNIGTTFLIGTFSYEDLLFNAVALAFVFDLPEFLYTILIGDELKETLQDAGTEEYATILPTSWWAEIAISKAFWGIVIIPLFTLFIIRYNYYHNIAGSLEALECACFQAGPNCLAAQRFSSSWWDKYWQDTFPLAKLRSSYLS